MSAGREAPPRDAATDIAGARGGDRSAGILALTHGDGSNVNVGRLMGSLRRAGFSVGVVAWDRSRRYPDRGEVGGLPYRFILHGGGFANRRLALWYPLWMLRLLAHLLGRRPDLIWASNFETAFPAAVASLFTRVPFVYYIHDNLCMTYRYPVVTDLVFSRLDRWTISRAEAVLVPDASRIEPHARPFAERFRILPNAPLRASLDAHRSADAERPFEVYLSGSLWETRGVGVLLDALQRVPGARALVAGRIEDAALESRLRSCPQVDYVGSLDHDAALDMYGRCKAVFAFYDPAIPINRNASPTKLYEALGMGVPVIMNSEVNASRSLVELGCAYTCSYHDVDGLAAILRALAEHPGDAADKGRRGRAVFEERFAWERLEPLLWQTLDAAVSVRRR